MEDYGLGACCVIPWDMSRPESRHWGRTDLKDAQEVEPTDHGAGQGIATWHCWQFGPNHALLGQEGLSRAGRMPSCFPGL